MGEGVDALEMGGEVVVESGEEGAAVAGLLVEEEEARGGERCWRGLLRSGGGMGGKTAGCEPFACDRDTFNRVCAVKVPCQGPLTPRLAASTPLDLLESAGKFCG